MRSHLGKAALACLLLSLTLCACVAQEGNTVRSLTDDTFWDVVTAQGSWAMLFLDDDNLDPVWQSAWDAFRENSGDEDLQFATLKTAEAQSTVEHLAIQSTPSLLLVLGEGAYEFEGDVPSLDAFRAFLAHSKEAEAHVPADAEGHFVHDEHPDLDDVAAAESGDEPDVWPAQPHVVAVSDATFDDVIVASGGTWLVEFYAPWCGHCRAFAETYDAIAAHAEHELDGAFRVAKVNGDESAEVLQRFGVQFFPYLIVVQDGHYWAQDASLDKSLDNVVEWVMSSHDDESASPILEPGQVPEGAGEAASGGGGGGGEAYPVFEESDAMPMDDVAFDGRTSGEHADTVWVMDFYAKWCPHCRDLAPVFERVATHGKESGASWSAAKVDVDLAQEASARVGVEFLPTIAVIHQGRVYRTPKDWAPSFEAIVAFANGGYLEQDPVDLPPHDDNFVYRKREEEGSNGTPYDADVPEHFDESDVVVLTQANFDALARNGSNWMIDFYAPWCSHCKSLAPRYAEFATRSRTLGKPWIVAKMDTDAAVEVSARHGVEYLPTVIYYANKKWYQLDESEPTPESLLAFADGGYERVKGKRIPKPDTIPDDPVLGPNSVAATYWKTLTDTSFNNRVSEGTWVVYFWAPWCTACKAMTRDFNQLALSVHNQLGDSYHLGKVDTDAEARLAERFSVEYLPAMYLFKGGEYYVFDDSWQPDRMFTFVESEHMAKGVTKGTDRHLQLLLSEKVSNPSEIVSSIMTYVDNNIDAILYVTLAAVGVVTLLMWSNSRRVALPQTKRKSKRRKKL